MRHGDQCQGQASDTYYTPPSSKPKELSLMTNRAEDFNQIREALGPAVADETANSLVVSGESLAHLRALPDDSISLILTDPPYHSTKKANVYGDGRY